MLQPKRTKFRKAHKGRIHGLAKGGTKLNFGSFGLKAIEPERVTARQIEAARRAITRHLRRAGRVWIRIFPDVPVSSKPAEVRMGKGKGSPEFWVCRVKPGRIMFELFCNIFIISTVNKFLLTLLILVNLKLGLDVGLIRIISIQMIGRDIEQYRIV